VKATVQSTYRVGSNRLIGRALRRARSEPTFGRLFVRFALTGLVAMLIIAVVSFVIVRRTATKDAIQQATQLAELAGRGIAEPLITPGVLSGNPRALAQLNRVVHQRILRSTPIVRVKIWNDRGRVLYSDATELIGSTFTLGRDELGALRNGTTDSDDSDLSHAENRTERAFKHLIEVYVGIRGPNGGRLLYEDYERSSTIASDSHKEWISLLPALVGALLFLYLIQLPLAYSLAQRLRTRRREREQLLQRAIDASDLERRRIAADLHDGAVQRLAGVSISLAASARTTRPQDSNLAIEAAAAETRDVIRELRTLLVDIYPPTLQRAGLQPALTDLVAPLQKTGVHVNLDVPETAQLSEGTVALLYRVAQEAVRNVRTHSHATEVDVQLQVRGHTAHLMIGDNGRGFTPPGDGQRDGRGHFGLRLINDLVTHAGGHVSVTSAPGAGTRLDVTVNQP
jgi:two-component system, NarL family, sensor kinase